MDVPVSVSVVEFLTATCRRCGQPMGEHDIRPLHVPELPDVPSAEIVCPVEPDEGR